MAVEPFIDTMFCELTDEETQSILDHVRRTWKLGACRNCEGTFYQLLAQITLRFNSTPNIVLDTKAHERPSAALVCTTCGEVRVLDLTVAGVFGRIQNERRNKRPEPGPTSGPYR